MKHYSTLQNNSNALYLMNKFNFQLTKNYCIKLYWYSNNVRVIILLANNLK